MKILHVIPCFDSSAGGTAYAVKNIADSLSNFDVEQVILTAGDSDMDVDCAEITSFPDIGSFRAHDGFKAWLNNNVGKFDLVHIHSIWLFHSRVAANSAMAAGVPYVVSPHGMLDDWSMSQKAWKKQIYLSLFESRVLRNAAALHCTLEAETESGCVRRLDVRAEVIPLSLEGAFFEDVDVVRDPNQILYLGRLHYKKQPDVLIRSFIELARDKPDLSLVIAGSGDEKYVNGLRALAEGCSASISFIGGITGCDKVKLFKKSGFFALPSLQENFGITVAEAMAAGAVPVISDAVALAKIVADHHAGFVSEAIQSSFQKVLRSAVDEINIADFRSNGEDYARSNFSQDAVGRQFFAMYKKYSTGGAPATPDF